MTDQWHRDLHYARWAGIDDELSTYHIRGFEALGVPVLIQWDAGYLHWSLDRPALRTLAERADPRVICALLINQRECNRPVNARAASLDDAAHIVIEVLQLPADTDIRFERPRADGLPRPIEAIPLTLTDEARATAMARLKSLCR